jgi:hypothetical protein
MSLIKTARQAMNYCRNPSKLVELIWAELQGLDTRLSALDGAGEVELSMLEEGTEADVIVYDAEGVAQAVALSGDATLSASGALTIEEDAVTSEKIAMFTSEELTGTGEAQSVAHGLGVTPSIVLVGLTNVGTDGATVTEGTHGTANVNVTVTDGAKFKVLAIA